MIFEKIYLEENNENVYLEAYVADKVGDFLRDAILVIPGGGYGNVCSDREGEPIAMAFMPHGFNAFVLHYSVASKEKRSFPAQLIQASLAMKHIKDNAEKYNIDPERVFVTGFSAGGHLAASLATMWNDEGLRAKYGFEGEINKPNAAILCYPVITGGKFAHRGSFKNLLHEDDPNGEKTTYWSLENRVSDKTPPCFIWHTASDAGVPVENSLIFSMALSNAKIPFELHVFPEGVHGLSLATREVRPEADPYIGRWVELSAKWLSKLW